MSISDYLGSSPILDIVKYGSHHPLDAVSFAGTLRKHPYDAEKCLLLAAAQERAGSLEEGAVIEFRIADVTAAEELPSPVDERGAVRSLVRLWIRKGAIALRYEPFEVGDKLLGPRESAALRAKLSELFHAHAARH